MTNSSRSDMLFSFLLLFKRLFVSMDFVTGFVLLVFINLNLVFKSFKKSISVLLK